MVYIKKTEKLPECVKGVFLLLEKRFVLDYWMPHGFLSSLLN
jgi:hypothetical protein